MLEALGPEYLIDHCISVYNDKRRFESFHVYVTDCLGVIVRGLGGKVTKRYYDVLHPPKEDTQKPQEIVADLVARMGLREVSESDEHNELDGISSD